MSYVGRHPDNQAAYVELCSCADSETLPGLINVFKRLPPQAAKEHKLLLANLYLDEERADSAELVNEGIITADPNTPLAARAKLNNFYIDLYNEDNPADAANILGQVKGEASLTTPMELFTAEEALATYVDPKTGKMPYRSYQQSAVSKRLTA